MQTIIIDSKNNFNYISDIAKKELCDKFSFDVKNNKLVFNSEDSAFLQLKVSEILADESVSYKRGKPRAQGRIYKRLKRTSHLTVKVSDTSK